MWQAIELRELRVFLVLAEELHFGRTAQRVGLTQSRVSQSVRDLERKLGLPLAQRTSRRVTLTDDGRRFCDDVRAALGNLEGVLGAAYEAGRHRVEPVRLGVSNAAAIGPRLRAVITAYEGATTSGRVVEVVGLPFRDRFGPLRRGEVDLMMTGLPLAQADLDTGPVLDREPRLLAVARDHPLAERESVSIEDLADHRVGDLDIAMPPELFEELVPTSTPTGRPIPRAPRRIREPTELLVAVAAGQIVHPVVATFAAVQRPADVIYVPIRDMPESASVLAWRRAPLRPGVREFLRLMYEQTRIDRPD